MKSQKIILIVGGDPTGKDAGAIFLEDICSNYPGNNLFPFFFPRRLLSIVKLPKKWLGCKVKYFPHPFERLRFFKNINSDLLNYILHKINYKIYIPILTRNVLNYAKKEHCDLIWVILNTPSIIYLAKKIISETDLPLVCTVWDPPERFFTDLKMDSKRREKLLIDFEYILKNARRVGVASEGMQIEYKNRYGITSIRQINGIQRSLWQKPTPKLQDNNEFIIGFAGNLYARDEFNALVSALDSHDWIIENHRVTMMVIGTIIPNNDNRERSIQFFNWQSLDNTILLLSKTDITYVPYWFDDKYSLAIRLCFPNKISTYLAAGKPILYHGPANSSPGLFLERYPVGLCCPSLEKEQIINCLRRFIIDPEFYKSSVTYVQIALQEELNQKQFLDRFADLIRIDELNSQN